MISPAQIFLVIPSFNEEGRLENVVRAARRRVSCPIVIVDDGSVYPVTLSLPGVTVLRHEVNLGKGAAMKTGAVFAFSHPQTSAVIFMDADGQHDPNHLPAFIAALGAGSDVVLGTRVFSPDSPAIRRLGGKLASWYIWLLFGLRISDILSGFRALTRGAFQLLSWEARTYGVETEMIALLGRHKSRLKFVEIPITNIYIDKYKGVTIIDALRILSSSLWWKLS